jgi:hypothetical protein
MPGRKVRDESDARSLLELFESSSLSVAQFAAVHQVDGRSFQCWKYQLRRRASKPSPRSDEVRFVELISRSAPVAAAPGPVYRLSIGQVSIELEGNFDDQVVLRLLRVAGQC